MTIALSAEDRLDIQDLIARYAWALDTADEAGFVDCFAKDGELVWEVFETPAAWRGHEALARFIAFFRSRPESAGRQHHVSNIVLEPSDEGAVGRCYVAVALRQGDGPHRLNVMGWYEDRYVCEDGRWKIAQRVIRDWSGPVMGRFAGQTGERIVRQRPPALDALDQVGKDR
jgi:ketosteroid isomerase-like protein